MAKTGRVIVSGDLIRIYIKPGNKVQSTVIIVDIRMPNEEGAEHRNICRKINIIIWKGAEHRNICRRKNIIRGKVQSTVIFVD